MPSGDTPDLNLLFPQRSGAPEQKLFGRYTLKRVLGRGGMGIVWMAHDDELHRFVAMKFLPDMLIRDREAVNDLKRETRRSLDLTHHHIVRIYDFTQDDICAAIIMEYVDGETLSAMKTQQTGGCFSVPTIAAWVAHFCQALDYAHRQARVVHRDLKPANLMVNSRGDLKVTDFGISRSMSDSMTRVSMSNTAGTLAYMSPEQALGAPPAPGDDVYAFGATVYDLLTGRPPFFRGNIQVQLETVIPPRMAERREELGNQGEPIPDLWEEVVATCLAKRPQDRPQTMGEIAVMLGLGTPSSSLRTTFVPGTGMGTASGIPGTTSTHARTASTDEAATRTDAIPRAPQTTKPAAPGTRGAPYVSTPRPTALRDVIPGFIDEPAAKQEASAPKAETAKPPATTPTRATLEKSVTVFPPPPEPIVPAAEPEPVSNEIAPPVEAPSEPAAPIVPEELDVTSKAAPAPELSIVTPIEEPAVVEARVEVTELPIEFAVPLVEEPSSEVSPDSEAEVVIDEEPPPSSGSDAVAGESDFPTLVGGTLVEPEALVTDDQPIIEPATLEIPAAEDSEVLLQAAAVEEPAALFNGVAVDEAAVTQFAGTALPAEPEPVVETPPDAEIPPTPTETSNSVAIEEPVSSPSGRKSKSVVPIAVIAGLVAIVGIWIAIPKGDSRKTTDVVEPTPVPVVQPTPDPKIAAIKTNLELARTHFSNGEFDEALTVLKAVQGMDSENAEALALLTQVTEAKRAKEQQLAMAERDKKIEGYIQQAKAAKERRDWQGMRAAIREVRKLDFQNALARSDIDTLDAEATEGERLAAAEMERQQKEAADAKRQKELADMRDADAARQREAEAAAEAERKRVAAQQEAPARKRASTPRPQRRTEDDSSDRPVRRPVVNRTEDRPPAPTQTRSPARSTPAPVAPRRPPNVFRGGAPGG